MFSRLMPVVTATVLAVAALAVCDHPGAAQDRPSRALAAGSAAPVVPPVAGQPRSVAFISDLHFGLGRRVDGTWAPKEDFRWSGALAGFLDELSKWGEDRVDLVIVGD